MLALVPCVTGPTTLLPVPPAFMGHCHCCHRVVASSNILHWFCVLRSAANNRVSSMKHPQLSRWIRPSPARCGAPATLLYSLRPRVASRPAELSLTI